MNSEKIAISNEGISVKSPNETIYFRFAIEPLTFNEGIPAFTYINFKDLTPYLEERGYRHTEQKINDGGSLLVSFSKT